MIGALIGAAGSIASSAIGAKASRNEGRANREWQSKENQLGRDFQLMMWNKNKDYTERMYHYNNKYNSPAAQRDRLKSAGYNPALAMYGGAQSVGQSSAPATPEATMPYQSTSLPYHSASSWINPMVEGVSQAFQNLPLKKAQENVLNKQGDLLDKDISWKDRLNSAFLKKALGETDFTKSKTDYQKTMNKFAPQTMQLQNDMVSQNLLKVQEETQNIRERTIAQRIQNSYMPEQLKSTIAQNLASSFSLYQSGNLSRQMMRTEVFNTTRMSYEAAKSRMDVDFKGKTKDTRMKMLDEQYKTIQKQQDVLLEQLEKARKENNWYEYNQIMGSISQLASSISTGVAAGVMIGKFRRGATPPASPPPNVYQPSSGPIYY